MFEVKESGIHHKGVFARKFIPKGTRIIQYVGDKISKEESDKRTNLLEEQCKKDSNIGKTYMYELDDEYDVDGNSNGNESRFINHSCDPNCEADIEHGEIWISAVRDIFPGEELSYNYGFEYDKDYAEHPCKCGSEKCVGFIVAEEDWPKFPKKETAKDNRQK
jgi:SET domain-containing protein